MRLVREGEPGAEDVTIIREVDPLSRYSLRIRDLAHHLGMTEPRTRALIRHLDLTTRAECFKEIRIDHSRFKRYSPEALHLLGEAMGSVDMEAVWQEHGSRRVSTPSH